ncbi:hypothetical protein [Phaeobacter gallaeciensis]|uniref:hypothetical protein n=1 Tax=Phaeobacter gallaeciensis TaxID=60890 RepID=UPI00237FA984|nr:hypothetical protein [Phaeobacter gallaeciensis]MDE4063693.1 hypothetical protein [Phaeobacter gallaeciensis]MDE4126712.1 hypothetical protein [Phaeobacter gallaeciensis]MDE4131189.1 hypothetical protein [Phaeobacter gallaeciensis]
MKVEAVDPRTGSVNELFVQASSIDDIKDLLSFDLPEEALKKRLDNLAISADAKSLLFTLIKSTIKVGTVVVKIGRKFLDLIITILADFPTATTGAIFGAILGHLIGSIPVVGLVFGPFIGPLAIALGFAVGGLQDFSNRAMAQRVAASVASFDGLKPKV